MNSLIQAAQIGLNSSTAPQSESSLNHNSLPPFLRKITFSQKSAVWMCSDKTRCDGLTANTMVLYNVNPKKSRQGWGGIKDIGSHFGRNACTVCSVQDGRGEASPRLLHKKTTLSYHPYQHPSHACVRSPQKSTKCNLRVVGKAPCTPLTWLKIHKATCKNGVNPRPGRSMSA